MFWGSGTLGEALLFSKHLLIFKRIKHKPKNYTNEQLYELKTVGINSKINTHLNEMETKGAQPQSEAEINDLSPCLPPLSPFHSPFSSVFYLLLIFSWKGPISYYVAAWQWWDCQNVTALSPAQPCKLPTIDPATWASWSVQSCFDFFSSGKEMNFSASSCYPASAIPQPNKGPENQNLVRWINKASLSPHLIFFLLCSGCCIASWNVRAKQCDWLL